MRNWKWTYVPTKSYPPSALSELTFRVAWLMASQNTRHCCVWLGGCHKWCWPHSSSSPGCLCSSKLAQAVGRKEAKLDEKKGSEWELGPPGGMSAQAESSYDAKAATNILCTLPKPPWVQRAGADQSKPIEWQGAYLELKEQKLKETPWLSPSPPLQNATSKW